MATRDFDNVPSEDPNASDIESEKDVFNDETFGVDINDLEGNEFDFSSSSNAAHPQPDFSNQNVVTKHDSGHVFNVGDDNNDSDDVNEPSQQQQQWNKPFSQRNDAERSPYYRANDNSVKGRMQMERRVDQPSQTRQPQYFRQEQTEQNIGQQSVQPQQNPFRLNFAALSLAAQDQHRQNYGNEDVLRREYNQNQNPNYPNQRGFQNQFDNQQHHVPQNQGPNVPFQPFSFTGNGYRRPQWDDDNDDQQRNFHQDRRGYYNNNNNGGQPQYFRNRQQQQQSGNWQQRDHYGGGGGGRYGGYDKQRYDNNDYEDRGRWQHRDREHRHFERRGPHDPFAGLMTWREKLTVLRIQLLQIISDRGPNFDDYYARMLTEKRKEQSLRAGALATNPLVVPVASGNASPPSHHHEKIQSLSGNESSDNEEVDRSNRRHLGVDNQNRRRTVSASTDNNNNNQTTNTRNRIPIPRLSVVDVQPYKPLEFQGTLGKWTTTTVTRPRQIIDCSAMQNLDDLQETGGRKGESAAKLLIQALGSVERLYDFVLIAEELERQMKSGSEQIPVPPPDIIPEGTVEGALRVGSFQSTNMPKPIDPAELESRLLATRRNICLTLCAPTRLALILAIKKGRKILPRALKTLDRGRLYADSFELSFQLASVLCEHLPLLIRRETNAAALVAVVNPLCSVVKSVLVARNAMPSPSNSEDFLFTVRAILADKALSTRSPELVTLLASLVSTRKS